MAFLESPQIPRRLFVAFLLLLADVALADWPMFQKGAIHPGQTLHDAAEESTIAWSYTIPTHGGTPDDMLVRASPVIVDTFVYIPACDGVLYCLTLTTGDSVWAASICEDLRSTPAVSKDRVYILGDHNDRRVHCLDAADGDELWQSEPLGDEWEAWGGRTSWIDSSPVVVGDSVLYVGARDGYAYCLDVDDGDEIWSTHIGSYITSSPAVVDTLVLIGSSDTSPDVSGFYCLHAANGDTLWYYEYDNGNAGGTMSSPTVAGDKVYVGLNSVWRDGYWFLQGGVVACFALYPECDPPWPHYCKVEPLYQYGIQCDVRGTPVVIDTLVYATTGRGLYGLNLLDSLEVVLGTDHSTGIRQGGNEETWGSLGASCRFTVAEQETLLYVGGGGNSGGGGVFCLDRELTTVWSYETAGMVWTSPAIAKGRVVMGDSAGNIYCFIDTDSDGAMPPNHGAIRTGQVRPQSLHGSPNERAGPFMVLAKVQVSDRVAEFSVLSEPQSSVTQLIIYDVAGRVVRSLFGSAQARGMTRFSWDGETNTGRAAATGLYYYRIVMPNAEAHGSIPWLR